MNRNLFVFALLLFLIGVFLGAYILSFLGLLLLVPSLLSSRPPVRRPPQETRQEPRRIASPAPPQATPSAPAPQNDIYTANLPPPPPPQTFSVPLFPGTMFPSLSPTPVPMQPTKEVKGEKPEAKDELVEVGAILALLKLAFG